MGAEPRNLIGDYRLFDVLGQGAMGVVYQARHRQTGHRVALKTLTTPGLATLPGIRREIQALSRLKHPGVVRIVDHGVHLGLPWYAMELVAGRDLKAYRIDLGEGASPPWQRAAAGQLPEVLTLVRRLCSPLAFLHSQGMIHRDLKPANVVLRSDGWPVLVDFGLAARFRGSRGREELDVTGILEGTAAYMAPEQIRCEYLDARADLYALGCILFELITGRPPFTGRSVPEILVNHLQKPAPLASELVPEVPPGLDQLLKRLLAKERRQRLGYARDLERILRELGAAEESLPEVGPGRDYLYRPGFSGRQEALEQLRQARLRLSQKQGGILLVAGESGAGKTRLAMEAARRVRAAGLDVITGRCEPREEGAPVGAPLHPLSGLLRAVADRCRVGGQEATEQLLGDRGPVLGLYEPSLSELPGQGDRPAPEQLGPRDQRLRLQLYLLEVMTAFIQARPLLLILDDLQWADELTISWLRFLSAGDRLDSIGLLILGTLRPEEAGPELREWVDQVGLGRLDLDRLDQDAVRTMVGDMLALAPPPDALVTFLAERSEGNPFFVAEYLRTAVAEGLLYRREDGGWRTAEPRYSDLPVPASLAELVHRRLAGLPEEARRLVQCCSVAGREIPLELLEALEPGQEVLLGGDLHELIRRHVLEEAHGGLRFAHDQIREAAYDEITPGRRRVLHRRAADALESGLLGEPRDGAAELGWHQEQAGRPARARIWYRLGADQAVRRNALGEAEDLFRKALALMDPVPGEQVEVRLDLAEFVLLRRGRSDEARREIHRALETAERLGDTRSRVRGLWAEAGIEQGAGQMEEAQSLLEVALEIQRREGHRLEEGRSLSHLGHLRFQRGDREQGQGLLEEALAIHRELEDEPGEGATLDRLSTTLAETGQPERALELHRRAVEIHRRTGNHHREAVSLSNLALLLATQGRMDEVETHLEESLAIVRRIGERRYEGRILANLTAAQMELGRYDRAVELGREALVIHRAVGERLWEAAGLLNLGAALFQKSSYQEAQEAQLEALEIFRAVEDQVGMGIVWLNLGGNQAALGLPVEARDSYHRAIQILDQVGHTHYQALARLGLGILERRAWGDLSGATRTIDKTEELFRELSNRAGQLRCLVQWAHIALARGEEIPRDLLAQCDELAREETDPSLQDGLRELGHLRRALEGDLPLIQGECADQFPPELLEWLEGAAGRAK